MDFKKELPVYLQVATQIKEQVLSGELELQAKLPSVRELSVRLEVSPLTVQRAIGHLCREGIVLSQKGVGSFVCPDARERLQNGMLLRLTREYVEQLQSCGLSGEEILTLVTEVIEHDEIHRNE